MTEDAGAAQGGGAVTQAQFKKLEARVAGVGQNSSAAQRISKNLQNVLGKHVTPEGTLIGARQPPGVIRQDRGVGGGLPTPVIADGAITEAKLAPGLLTQASAAGASGPTGTGATGPQGPGGATGPQGPGGLSAIEQVSSAVIPLETGDASTQSVFCPFGKSAISGGVRQTTAGGSPVFNTNAARNVAVVHSSRLGVNRWRAVVANIGTVNRFFVVSAICAIVDS